MQKPFLPQFQPSDLASDKLWFIFKGDELLVQKTTPLQIPQVNDIAELPLVIQCQHYLGIYETKHCFVIETSTTTALPADMQFIPLRLSYEAFADHDLLAIAARGKQILNWDKSTQFCGCCGQPTVLSSKERAKICTHCQTMVFPQIAPVVLVRINRGQELLLARSPHFTSGVYSVLAGFIEPGESAEQAIHREVAEEVGIKITNIQYFGSQSWPFPSNLMLGFTAEYASGQIQIDPVEIEDAKWFSPNQLPELPKQLTLSRQLIDAFAINL